MRLHRFLSFALVWLVFGTGFTMAAHAQGNCNTHDIVQERLADGYGERVVVRGLSGNDTVMELWANPETGTWTLTASDPSGWTCAIGSGEGYVAVPIPDEEA